MAYRLCNRHFYPTYIQIYEVLSLTVIMAFRHKYFAATLVQVIKNRKKSHNRRFCLSIHTLFELCAMLHAMHF